MRHTLRYVALLFAWLLPQIPMAQQHDIQFDHLNTNNGYDMTVYKKDAENTRISNNDHLY